MCEAISMMTWAGPAPSLVLYLHTQSGADLNQKFDEITA